MQGAAGGSLRPGWPILASWLVRVSPQHSLPHGADETAEEDVRAHASGRDHHGAGESAYWLRFRGASSLAALGHFFFSNLSPFIST